MRSSLIASTALAAALFAAGPALADQHGAGGSQADAVQTETTERDGVTVTTTTGGAEQPAQPTDQQAAAQPQGMELVGKKVMGQGGDEVGEIKNVLIDTQGQPTHVIVGHGGWLGMGEKEVALDLKELQVSQEEVRVSMTDDQLSALPEYKSPEEREGQQQPQRTTETITTPPPAEQSAQQPQPQLRQDSAANPLPEPAEQPDVPARVGAPVPPNGTVAGPSGASKDFTPPLADEPMRPRNPSE